MCTGTNNTSFFSLKISARSHLIDSPPTYNMHYGYKSWEAFSNLSYYTRALPPVPDDCPTPMGVKGEWEEAGRDVLSVTGIGCNLENLTVNCHLFIKKNIYFSFLMDIFGEFFVNLCKLLHESEWAFWYNVMMFSNSFIQTELMLVKQKRLKYSIRSCSPVS